MINLEITEVVQVINLTVIDQTVTTDFEINEVVETIHLTVAEKYGSDGPPGPPGPPGTSITKTSELENNGEDGINPFITAKDVSEFVDKNYIHDQPIPNSIWTINHPLNKKVSVTIIDTSGNVVEGKVTINNGNKVVIEFNFPFSGEAILN